MDKGGNNKDHNHNICLLGQTIEDAIEAYGDSVNYYELVGILVITAIRYAMETIVTEEENGQ